MALSSSDRRDIEEVIEVVIQRQNARLFKEIVAGYVEVMDWYTETLGRIMMSHVDRHADEVSKALQEQKAKRPNIKGFTG